MIAEQQKTMWLVKASAPLAWRSRKQVHSKLLGFSATEAGSALDMFQAAELTDDPHLRRLFFKHALDEARHARMFAQHAKHYANEAERGLSEYARVHAVRQNLLKQLGVVRFVAFVHWAEKQGQAHFEALSEHFADEPQLQSLFSHIEKDERFHVGYTGKILEQWRAEGRDREVRSAIRKVRWTRAWEAWRRAGRRMGDFITRGILTVLYFSIFPVFALVQRTTAPKPIGWTTPKRKQLDAAALRKQS